MRAPIKPTNRSEAINAFCVDCIYDPSLAEGVLNQVRDCTVTECPLFKFRPQRSVGKAGAALARYRRAAAKECK